MTLMTGCPYCSARAPEDEPLHHDPDCPELDTEEADQVDTCRVDGCSNESAGKRGSWVGLCSQHISEEARRRQAKRRGRDSTAEASLVPPPVEPAVTGNGSLVALAERVEQARHELGAAVAALARAVEEIAR